MKRLLLILFVAVPASASVGMYSTSPGLSTIARRGTLVRFQFEPFVNDVDEHDVVVTFDAAPATIESASSIDFTCTASGSTARCTRSLFPGNTTSGITLQVRMPLGTGGYHLYVTGTITAASGATATWRPDVFVPKAFVVDGSLADAINAANASCTNSDPCDIEFPSAATLSEPLPAITAKRVSLIGGKQVVLDGTGLVFNGANDVTVTGFTIQNFDGPAILLLADPRTSSRATISDDTLTGNLRGLMSDNTAFLYLHDNVITNNRRSGVWITNGYYPAVYENTITGNGASGVYFGPGCRYGMADENTIAANRDFGVAVDPNAKWIEVRGNSMKENGQLGIDFDLDLMTPNVPDDSSRSVPNAPLLTSATYDPVTTQTIVSGHVDLIKPADVGYFAPLIDFYASKSLDAHGMAQGEKPLHPRVDYGLPVRIDPAGNFIFIYNGDLRGQFISATYTRMYALGKGAPSPQYYENWQATSEFSNPVRVAP